MGVPGLMMWESFRPEISEFAAANEWRTKRQRQIHQPRPGPDTDFKQDLLLVMVCRVAK